MKQDQKISLPMVEWGFEFRSYSIKPHFKCLYGEGNGNLLQYSCQKIPWMEEPGRLQSMGLLKSRTRLSNFTFTFHFHALEKEMATHSSVLAWRIPGTVEPDGLPSMGSHRVGHDWSDLAEAAAAADKIGRYTHTYICSHIHMYTETESLFVSLYPK